jgi:hypothetical protein
MKSLADIFRGGLHPHADRKSPSSAKNGRSIPPTIDYGLMYINSSKIERESVEDPCPENI